MKSIRFGVAAAMALALGACGMRTGTSVEPPPGATPSSTATTEMKPPAKSPDAIIVTEDDITDRPYQNLGDIKVDLEKWTVFDKDPTREMIDKALKQKAAEMGADAVVLARYGTVGIGAFSWGKMEGQGRAVAFK